MKRSIMGRVHAFNNGVLMLCNISAPFFERIGYASKSRHFRTHFLLTAYLSPRENVFWVSKWFHVEAKRSILEPIGENAPKWNTMIDRYIYIYLSLTFFSLYTYEYIHIYIYIYRSLSLSFRVCLSLSLSIYLQISFSFLSIPPSLLPSPRSQARPQVPAHLTCYILIHNTV